MISHPTKQQVQQYLKDRHESEAPPPSPEEIRRHLGWGMVQANHTPSR